MGKYVLYHSENNGSYSLIEESDDSEIGLLEQDARVIWSVQAKSWDIARMRKHEFLGWEPYRPPVSSTDDLRRFLPVDKHDLDSIQLMENIGFPAIKPVIADLLKWMQDFNWPIAKRIAPFLVKLGPSITSELEEILATDDSDWKYWILSEIISQIPGEELGRLKDTLSELENLSEEDVEWEVAETAQEILSKTNPKDV